jgi:hypothetical protein
MCIFCQAWPPLRYTNFPPLLFLYSCIPDISIASPKNQTSAARCFSAFWTSKSLFIHHVSVYPGFVHFLLKGSPRDTSHSACFAKRYRKQLQAYTCSELLFSISKMPVGRYDVVFASQTNTDVRMK